MFWSADTIERTAIVRRLCERRGDTAEVKLLSVRIRLVVMVICGVLAAAVCGLLGRWDFAPLVGWIAAALSFEILVWGSIVRMDADQTKRNAEREDPSLPTSDLLLLVANLASLSAVAYVIVESGNSQGAIKVLLGALAVLGVAISWLLVQTLFTLRYAVLYYSGDDGGIDFNQSEPPSYGDFAYLAFTMGMTYQVSDTNLSSTRIRRSVLRHALISYVFGSVVLATTINLVVGLANA